MRVSVLGPIEIEGEDGERVAIGSANQRAVVAMLVARAGAVVEIDELIDGIWGTDPPPSAVQSLRTYVSRLRKVLGPALEGRDGGYVLTLPVDAIDSVGFEADIAAGRHDAALARWRGRPFGDAADLPVVESEARRLEALAQSARSGRLDELLAAGRLPEVVSGAEAVLVTDPEDERAWAALVRGLGRSGRSADALRAFQRANDRLADAGLVVGPDLRAAEAEVLAGPAGVDPSRRRTPPAPLTPSVGRRAEIDRISEILVERRVVTLVGPGGVGKTRLATEVGRATAERHQLGARIVELARISAPDAIGPAIARALDLTGGRLDDVGAIDALLVLDNCEHLIDAVSATVPDLLGGGDRLRILATSREPLGVLGEQRWPLAPLSTIGADAPAVELFVQRARDAGVELDPGDHQVAAIVAHLDGLPLALEMAATRLATMAPGDLAAELDETVASLRAAHRGAEERHGTLRAVLAWSEALLSDAQRQALAEFSVFAGPVHARDLAAAIADGDPTTMVCSLAERSLVTVDTSGTHASYGSLETVRQFGRERLAQTDRLDDVARRHALWFTEAAEAIAVQIHTPDEAHASARVDDIFDELRAAHLWARSSDPGVAVRLSNALFQPAFQGLRLEILDWTLALAETVADDDPVAPGLFGDVAMGLSLVGRLDGAVEWAERSLAASRDADGSVSAYSALADVALYRGDLDGALEAGRRYYAAASRHGSALERIYAKASIVLPLAYLGRPDEALAEIPATAGDNASPMARAWLGYMRGEVLLDLDPDDAARHLTEAVALAETVRGEFLVGVARVSLASLHARHGDPAEAAEPLAHTIERFADRGNATHLLTSLRNLPTLFVRAGRADDAAAMIGTVDAAALSPTYGDEADRLETARAEAREALGDERYGRAVARGREQSLDAAARGAVALLRSPTFMDGD